MAAPTHATFTDPPLNPCMNLSWTASCLPGTRSSPSASALGILPKQPLHSEGGRENSASKPGRPTPSLLRKSALRGWRPHQPSLHTGKLRLRTTLPCRHPAQVRRLRLSLLFIELQVEMCRFGGASPPPPPPPHLGNSSSQRQEMGVGKVSGNEAGPPEGPRIKHG